MPIDSQIEVKQVRLIKGTGAQIAAARQAQEILETDLVIQTDAPDLVPDTRTINGKELSSDISLNASDVGALPDTTIIPTVGNGTITITQGGSAKGSFTTNQSGNTTIDLDAGGGGAVDSVNGKIGTVVLDASDVGALPDTTVIPVVNNATLTIQKNGTTINTFTANASSDVNCNITVPTNNNELTNGENFIKLTSLSGTSPIAYNNSTGVISVASGYQIPTTAQVSQIGTNTNDISTINSKIPAQATSSNQLADKSFVNSSISTNTANFIGTFNSVADLEAYSGTLTNNDYAFVIGTDQQGNTVYNRYKYTTATNPAEWEFEYALNNSSFTANQWAAINSGATTTNIALAESALQSGDNISELNNNVGYITSSALNGYATQAWVGQQGYITGITSSDVTIALGYTPYNSSNPAGYITSSALSGYQTTANLVTSVSSSSTDSQYPSAKLFYDTCGNIETLINAL